MRLNCAARVWKYSNAQTLGEMHWNYKILRGNVSSCGMKQFPRDFAISMHAKQCLCSCISVFFAKYFSVNLRTLSEEFDEKKFRGEQNALRNHFLALGSN